MRLARAWLLAALIGALGGVGTVTGVPSAQAAEVYLLTTDTVDTCAAWTSTPTSGHVVISSGGGPILGGTLTVTRVFGSAVQVPVTGSSADVSLQLPNALSGGAYDVSFQDVAGDTSPTYRLNVCLPGFVGIGYRVTGTTANLLVTVTTPFTPASPYCVAAPSTVDGVDQDWEFSAWGTVRNQSASGWEVVQPIAGPAPLEDGARIDGYVICASSPTDPSAKHIVGTFTVQLPSFAPFVRAAYADFLGRPAAIDEVDSWVYELAAVYTTREGFLRSLATSTEWLSVIVRKMYLDTLGREPDPAGLSTWVSWIRTGRFTVAQAAALFYSSEEFYLGLGGNDLSTWVTRLYEKLLGRAPDPAGLQFWVAYAANPAYGRVWVAGQFYQSLESRLTRVRNLYEVLLKRGPDPTGWPFWAETILVQGDLQLAVSLASSQEYDLRAQARFPG